MIHKYNSELIKSGIFKKKNLKKFLEDKGEDHFLNIMGIVAERTILLAFDSGGFGKWKPSNMFNKTVHMTLIETQQLRNSISYEVIKKK